MDKKKKIIAAVSGVMHYIKTQEEAAMAASMGPLGPALGATPAPPVNAWGMHGRQAMMQMRGMMQMKVFQGTKLS